MPITGAATIEQYNYDNAVALLDAQIADADRRIALAKEQGDQALRDKKTAQTEKMKLPHPAQLPVEGEPQSAKAEKSDKVEEDADPEEPPETKVDKPEVGRRVLGKSAKK